jgi:hypothetical protein
LAAWASFHKTLHQPNAFVHSCLNHCKFTVATYLLLLLLLVLQLLATPSLRAQCHPHSTCATSLAGYILFT